MRLTLTQVEIETSQKIQTIVQGLSYDEACHAINHAQGSILNQFEDIKRTMVVRPKEKDSL